jgi:hypothetical protein
MADAGINLERLHDFIPFDCLSESHLRDIAGQIQVLNLAPATSAVQARRATRAGLLSDFRRLDLIDAGFQVRKFPSDDDENYLALDNYPNTASMPSAPSHRWSTPLSGTNSTC